MLIQLHPRRQRPGLILSQPRSFTALDSSSGLATACFITPMFSDGLPRCSARSRARSLMAPMRTPSRRRAAAPGSLSNVGDDDGSLNSSRASAGRSRRRSVNSRAWRTRCGPAGISDVLAADRVSRSSLHRQACSRPAASRSTVDAHRRPAARRRCSTSAAPGSTDSRGLHVALDVIRGLQRRLVDPAVDGDVDHWLNESASTLAMIGSSTVSGSLPRERATTLSRTSAAAESGSRFRREPDVDLAALRARL